MPTSLRQRLRSNDGRSSRASSTGENEENSSGSAAASANAAVAAPATAMAPAMIFKLHLRGEIQWIYDAKKMVSRVGAHVPGSLGGHTRERAVPDGIAMIEKLWSSSRGKKRHETFIEVDEEEDEVVSEQYQMACMINALTRSGLRMKQLSRILKLLFRRYSPGLCRNNSLILKPPACETTKHQGLFTLVARLSFPASRLETIS